MPESSSATAYTTNPGLTEQAFADQIRSDIEQKYDADQPTKTFSVCITVEEVEEDE